MAVDFFTSLASLIWGNTVAAPDAATTTTVIEDAPTAEAIAEAGTPKEITSANLKSLLDTNRLGLMVLERTLPHDEIRALSKKLRAMYTKNSTLATIPKKLIEYRFPKEIVDAFRETNYPIADLPVLEIPAKFHSSDYPDYFNIATLSAPVMRFELSNGREGLVMVIKVAGDEGRPNGISPVGYCRRYSRSNYKVPIIKQDPKTFPRGAASSFVISTNYYDTAHPVFLPADVTDNSGSYSAAQLVFFRTLFKGEVYHSGIKRFSLVSEMDMGASGKLSKLIRRLTTSAELKELPFPELEAHHLSAAQSASASASASASCSDLE